MRDIELFKLLYRYQYLRSDVLYAFLGGDSQTRFKKRLGDLYHEGKFVNRPEQQWQFARCRCMPLVYELDVRGEQVLRDQGLPVYSSPLLTKGRMGVARQFAHQLMICDCLASIERRLMFLQSRGSGLVSRRCQSMKRRKKRHRPAIWKRAIPWSPFPHSVLCCCF
jgi:hypothetical protein